jgi:hypothetical protein
MITDRQRYEDRHRRIVQRCEQRLRERLEEDPSLTIEAIVDDYALNVRKAIQRRDSISSVYAVMGSHLAMSSPETGLENRKETLRFSEAESHSPIPLGA